MDANELATQICGCAYPEQRKADIAAILAFREAGIIAYLAALEAEGFVMVPVEPTEAMLEAGHLRDPLGCDIEPNDAPMIYERIWEAMIAARPQVKENGNG
jgi:hypothetical protein